MNQLYLLSNFKHAPGLIFLPLYGGISIFLMIVLFKNRTDSSVKKLLVSLFSLLGVLLFQSPDLPSLAVKLSIFTTPFVVIMLQRIDIIRNDTRTFLCFIVILWGVVFVTEFSRYSGWVDSRFYFLLLVIFMIIINVCLMLYFCIICNMKYDSIVSGVTKKRFHNILAIIAISIISANLVILVLSGGNRLYTFLPAFAVLFAIHAAMAYSECKNIFIKGNYGLNTGRAACEYTGRLEDSNVSDEVCILFRLVNLFEQEKLYLNPEITVSGVAARIYTNRTYLSRALNQRTSRNFNQFVNYYRIKEICEIFISSPDIKIQQLYEQCGFNTLSSFSSAFRINTGYTPAEWGREVRRKQAKNENVSVKDYIM